MKWKGKYKLDILTLTLSISLNSPTSSSFFNFEVWQKGTVSHLKTPLKDLISSRLKTLSSSPKATRYALLVGAQSKIINHEIRRWLRLAIIFVEDDSSDRYRSRRTRQPSLLLSLAAKQVIARRRYDDPTRRGVSSLMIVMSWNRWDRDVVTGNDGGSIRFRSARSKIAERGVAGGQRRLQECRRAASAASASPVWRVNLIGQLGRRGTF